MLDSCIVPLMLPILTFLEIILCFPAVKKLNIADSFIFDRCEFPEVSSFYTFLKSINVEDVKLYQNNFISIYISNIFKSLSFNKLMFEI
eukprot:snap_masked-scaffold_52-processed-gene-1.63-mRNA-1 protein AED:1.00 eAED:1.00 QI:0/0/0/0/1/1/4/0/88